MQKILELKKYIVAFLGVEIFLTSLSVAIAFFLEIESPPFFHVIFIFISCFVSVHIFTKDFIRAPDTSEKMSLVWGSFIVFIFAQALTLMLVFLLVMDGSDLRVLLEDFSPLILIMIVVFTSLLSFPCIWISYGAVTKVYNKSFEKKILDNDGQRL